MVHQGATRLFVVSVNVAVARSQVAWYGPLNWFAGVTQTVVPSVGRNVGRGFQGDELIVCGAAVCAWLPEAAAAADLFLEGLGRMVVDQALSCA